MKITSWLSVFKPLFPSRSHQRFIFIALPVQQKTSILSLHYEQPKLRFPFRDEISYLQAFVTDQKADLRKVFLLIYLSFFYQEKIISQISGKRKCYSLPTLRFTQSLAGRQVLESFEPSFFSATEKSIIFKFNLC